MSKIVIQRIFRHFILINVYVVHCYHWLIRTKETPLNSIDLIVSSKLICFQTIEDLLSNFFKVTW